MTMNSKRSNDNSENQAGRDDVPSTPAEAASEAVISVDNAQKDFRSVSEMSHANDQSPSQLELPAEGNNFRLTGEFQQGDGKKVVTEPLKTVRSITPEELEVKASRGDDFAAFFVKERRSILENFSEGSARDAQLSQLQANADKMFGVKVETPAAQPLIDEQAPYSTHEMKALAESHPLAAAGTEMLAATSDPAIRAAIKQDITNLMSEELAVPGEAPNEVVLQASGAVKLEINAVENSFVTELPSSGPPAPVVNDFQSAMSALSRLPIEQQLDVLGKGLETFRTSVDQQQRELAIGATIGVVQGVGNTLIGIVNFAQFVGDSAVFASDIATNNPRYLATADKVGESIGKTLVTGYRLFDVAKTYATQVDGNYKKPLQDINLVAAELDKQWQLLPPRERARRSAEFLTELGASITPVVGAGKLAETEKLVTTLEEVGTSVSKLDHIAKQSYVQGVSDLIGEMLTGKKAVKVTTAGKEVLIDGEEAVEQLSKGALHEAGELADDGVRRSDIGMEGTEFIEPSDFEKLMKKTPFEASPEFVQAVKDEVNKVEDFEKAILAELNGGPEGSDIGVSAIAKNRNKEDLLTTLGYFHEVERRLHVGEKVWQQQDWEPVKDIAHILRHEIGHAFNALKNPACNLYSNTKEFSDICEKVLDTMPEDQKYTLFSRFAKRVNGELLISDGKIRYNKAGIYDEIFAESYAHLQLGKQDLSYTYNQMMGHYFKEPTALFIKKVVTQHKTVFEKEQADAAARKAAQILKDVQTEI